MAEVIADMEPPTPPAPGRLGLVMAATVESRLNVAIALIVHSRLPVPMVLDLRWPQVNLASGSVLTDAGVTGLSEPLVDLVYWHAARQRLDRNRWRRSWPGGDRVVVDRRGEPYSWLRADNELALACRIAGLPIVNLNSLRHPVFR